MLDISEEMILSLSSAKKMQRLFVRNSSLFDEFLPTFYDEEDFKAGHINIQDRRGVLNTFPLISVAIGVVTEVSSAQKTWRNFHDCRSS